MTKKLRAFYARGKSLGAKCRRHQIKLLSLMVRLDRPDYFQFRINQLQEQLYANRHEITQETEEARRERLRTERESEQRGKWRELRRESGVVQAEAVQEAQI